MCAVISRLLSSTCFLNHARVKPKNSRETSLVE
jgi:hypothetical protein